MNKWTLAAILMMAGALTVSADVAAPARTMDEDVNEAIQLFKKNDTKMEKLFDSSYGYAVYPNVAKGGCLFGAGAGRGQVFERGRLIGTSKLSQLTIGAQLGGQKYAEVIFFETKDALDEFRKSDWTMAAGVSAVAAAEGASADAKYRHGVLIYTLAKTGLMFEAAVGGQRFKFTPLEKK